jgi:hypothetical protein
METTSNSTDPASFAQGFRAGTEDADCGEIFVVKYQKQKMAHIG